MTVLLKEILQKIDGFCPFALQEEWDNSGLQIGDPDSEIKKVLVAFDFTEEILAEAIENHVQLVITHHPFFFRGIRQINVGDAKGRMISGLIRNNIALVACHTNLDKVEYGVSAVLGKKLGLIDCRPLIDEGGRNGFGVIGQTAEPTTLANFADIVKTSLGIAVVRTVGRETLAISTVAAMGGAGSDFFHEAQALGADVYVTADLKYHDGQAAAEMGLAVIDAGHFFTEIGVAEPFLQKLADAMPEVTFLLSSGMKDFWTLR